MAGTDAAEMAALRQRFGKPTPGGAAFLAASILGTNAYLLYLVLTGASSAVGLAVYGVIELTLYSAISNTAMLAVPKQSRVGSPDLPLLGRLFAVAVIVALLLGIAWFGVARDRTHLDILRHARDPLQALRDLNVLWPLAVTAALAASGSVADVWRWRRRGGLFVNGLALIAASKFIAAIVGPPAAMFVSGAYGGDEARVVLVWCVVYLAIKCALELLFLYWQFLGMPERARSGSASDAGTRGTVRKGPPV